MEVHACKTQYRQSSSVLPLYVLSFPVIGVLGTLIDDVLMYLRLNHGMALGNDGKTLYASSSNNVYAWNYTAATGTVGSTYQIIVTNSTCNPFTPSNHSTLLRPILPTSGQ